MSNPITNDVAEANPEPTPTEIRVEERKLTLVDFTKTLIKSNGSDLHLQADSVPMIRVDGRARFLDCLPPSNELMAEYVATLLHNQDPERKHILEHKGAV